MRASDQAYASLRDEILRWELRPGSLLSEVDLAARLGVSRTPVREALARLEADGLAAPGRGRTTVVAPLDATDVVHLFELRQALELEAVRLAARRRTDGVFEALTRRFETTARSVGAGLDVGAYYALASELDVAVDAAAASPYLTRALQGLRGHVVRARRLAHDDMARLERAAREHALISRAVAERDEALAAHATAVHLDASLRNVLEGLAAQGGAGPLVVPSGATTSSEGV
ncbi:GntR family transcriptional regulator [Cellulomonas sp. APG4]|uniref:GntR family transcriptional regulator n=1 Tax=Cellulomonas sp. APG4 TaxID=1538656 RepID=UPI00137B6B13|nr:GntR family transcriptional regulator [Cellulomonas sp. APG4]